MGYLCAFTVSASQTCLHVPVCIAPANAATLNLGWIPQCPHPTYNPLPRHLHNLPPFRKVLKELLLLITYNHRLRGNTSALDALRCSWGTTCTEQSSQTLTDYFHSTAPHLPFDPACSPDQSPNNTLVMTTKEKPSGRTLRPSESPAADGTKDKVSLWKRMMGGTKSTLEPASSGSSIDRDDGDKARPKKWSMGILNDRQTDEVPGTCCTQSHSARHLLLKNIRGFTMDRGLYLRLAVG